MSKQYSRPLLGIFKLQMFRFLDVPDNVDLSGCWMTCCLKTDQLLANFFQSSIGGRDQINKKSSYRQTLEGYYKIWKFSTSRRLKADQLLAGCFLSRIGGR